jgi:hypothetical protein
LGIGLAIATLTFTFAVDQVFEIPTEPISASGERQNNAIGNASADTIGFSNITALFTLTLIGVTGLCTGLSAYFRVLYRRNDAALVSIERIHQEESP